MILIIILIISAIIAIITFLILEYETSSESGSGKSLCSKQSDCSSGYICGNDGVCRGGIGIPCMDNSDCGFGLGCLGDNNGRVCGIEEIIPVGQPTTIQNIIQPGTAVVPETVVQNQEDQDENLNKKICLDDDTTPSLPLRILEDVVEQEIPLKEFSFNFRASRPCNSVENIEPCTQGTSILTKKEIKCEVPKPTGKPSNSKFMQCPIEVFSGNTEDNSPATGDSGTLSVVSGYSSSSLSDVGAPIPGVIDVCSFANSILLLHEDGSITKNNNPRVHCNIKIQHMEVFAGYLYGLGSGMLYRLVTETMKDKRWYWEPCSWSPVGLSHMSSTLDTKNLWLQNKNKGYLYDQGYNLVETIKFTGKRIYGADPKHYIDISNHSAIVYPGKEEYGNVANAVMTYHGDVVILTTEQLKTYQNVRLVNWEPYYIVN